MIGDEKVCADIATHGHSATGRNEYSFSDERSSSTLFRWLYVADFVLVVIIMFREGRCSTLHGVMAATSSLAHGSFRILFLTPAKLLVPISPQA